MTETSFQAMGCTVELIVRDAGKQTESLFRAIRSRIAEYERLLSRFLPDSDVSLINSHPGQWVPVHPATMEVLLLAHAAFATTDGLFNPCLGIQLEQLGYDRTFYEIEPQLANGQPTAFVRPELPLQCCPAQGVARIEKGYKLDLGGIAKGWIVEQAAGILEDAGVVAFVCSAGGDMVCHGGPWQIGIEDPCSAGRCIASIEVDSAALATSGTYRRTWLAGERRVHHLIDPRTGISSTTDMVLCTVLHRSLVKAEVLAKVAILKGWHDAASFLDEEGAHGWFIVRRDGTWITSASLSTAKWN